MEQNIKDLIDLGFSGNEAKAYLNLLNRNYTATELSKLLRVNRTNVYKIINNLIEKGFCTKLTETSKFMAIDPQTAFRSISENFRNCLEQVKRKTVELKKIFDTFHAEEDLEVVKILYSKASIEDTINKLESQAEQEVLAFCKGPDIMNLKQLEAVEYFQKERMSYGVTHKAIYEIEPGNDRFRALLKRFSKLGGEIRVIEYLPLKLLVYDSKIAVFTFEEQGVDTTFTSLADEDVAKTFRMIFQVYWETAIPLKEYFSEDQK